MNKRFQIFAILILLVVVILASYFSSSLNLKKVNDFESCVSAGNLVMESYPRKCRHNDITYREDIGSEIEIYFRNELYEQAVKNAGGMPIEGFNPGMYKNAFPGIEYIDFDGAEAIGGIWKFDNGRLGWIEDNPSGVITSADGTLTNEGLDKLLENLQDRLEIKVNFPKDIDLIISLLNIHKCETDERLAEACIATYIPVCGWNDSEKIQCIKYPCAQDYSNGCEACKNKEVKYWTSGMCPA